MRISIRLSRKRIGILIVLELAILLGSVLPGLYATQSQADFDCSQVSIPVVCIKPGSPPNVTIQNGYGKLIPQYNMAFRSYSTYPNGTIYFNATDLAGPNQVPGIQHILTFQVQAYGNASGTFDIRIAAPRAVNIRTDGIAQTFAQASWGKGPEIIFNSPTASLDYLVVNWIDVGGACTPFCIQGVASGSDQTFSWLMVAGIGLVVGLVVIFGRKPFGSSVKPPKDSRSLT